MRDKIIYALTRFPGVSEELAKKLKAAGIDSPKKLKLAGDKALKEAGLKTADLAKLRARVKAPK